MERASGKIQERAMCGVALNQFVKALKGTTSRPRDFP
jgi:hypothetical protein